MQATQSIPNSSRFQTIAGGKRCYNAEYVRVHTHHGLLCLAEGISTTRCDWTRTFKPLTIWSSLSKTQRMSWLLEFYIESSGRRQIDRCSVIWLRVWWKDRTHQPSAFGQSCLRTISDRRACFCGGNDVTVPLTTRGKYVKHARLDFCLYCAQPTASAVTAILLAVTASFTHERLLARNQGPYPSKANTK